MSPFSAVSFVGKDIPNLALNRTIAAHHKHPVCFMLLLWCCSPLLLFLKLQVFKQRLIQNFLWICSWTQLYQFHTWHNPLYIETACCIVGIFGTYPFEILFQQQRFSLLCCFPLEADGFVRCFFVG